MGVRSFHPFLRICNGGVGGGCASVTTKTTPLLLLRAFQSTFPSRTSVIPRSCHSHGLLGVVQPTRYLRIYPQSWRPRESSSVYLESGERTYRSSSTTTKVLKKMTLRNATIVSLAGGIGLGTGLYYYWNEEKPDCDCVEQLPPGIQNGLLLSEREFAKRISEDPLWILSPAARKEMDAYCKNYPISGNILKGVLPVLLSEVQKVFLNAFKLCKAEREVSNYLGSPIFISTPEYPDSDLSGKPLKNWKRGKTSFQIVGPKGKGIVSFELDKTESFKYVEVDVGDRWFGPIKVFSSLENKNSGGFLDSSLFTYFSFGFFCFSLALLGGAVSRCK